MMLAEKVKTEPPEKARKTTRAPPSSKLVRFFLVEKMDSTTRFSVVASDADSDDVTTMLFISSKISFGESSPSTFSTPRNHLSDTTASS